MAFRNWFAEAHIIVVFFGCAPLGPSCQQRVFWRKNRHGRVWLITALLIFGGRVQGSGEVAWKATSLGPKPSLYFGLFFLFLEDLFCLVFFCVLASFQKKNPVLSPWQMYFCLCFSISLCFSLVFFPFSLSLSPLYLYIYIYVSLSLSLSISRLFLFFFLFPPRFLSEIFSFFCFLVFVSLLICVVSLLLLHEKNNIKILT